MTGISQICGMCGADLGVSSHWLNDAEADRRAYDHVSVCPQRPAQVTE